MPAAIISALIMLGITVGPHIMSGGNVSFKTIMIFFGIFFVFCALKIFNR